MLLNFAVELVNQKAGVTEETYPGADPTAGLDCIRASTALPAI
ncbi:hypothetical protein [Massilia phyllosphaerae]|nr:hypothetical protein [Massilia sp. SGZ-792]